MPSLARTLGLLFLLAAPAWLAAQTNGAAPGYAERQPGPAAQASWLDPPSPPASQTIPSPPEQPPNVVVPAAYQAPATSSPPLPLGEGQGVRGTENRPPMVTTPHPGPSAAGEGDPKPPAATVLLPKKRSNLLPLATSHALPGETNKLFGRLPGVATLAGSMALVLGLFFLFAWFLRRGAPQGTLRLPGEVLEVLGRAPLAHRQQVYLLRCGNKLLLVSVTPAGAETLSEITDATEVDRLAGLCRQSHPQSATAAFRQVFQQLDGSRAGRGPEAEIDFDAAFDSPSLAGGPLPVRTDPWEKYDA